LALDKASSLLSSGPLLQTERVAPRSACRWRWSAHVGFLWSPGGHSCPDRTRPWQVDDQDTEW